MAQLDAQWKECKRSFTRRLETVGRIQQAASSLVERIVEIEAAERERMALQQWLAQWLQQLLGQPAPQTVNTVQDITPVL